MAVRIERRRKLRIDPRAAAVVVMATTLSVLCAEACQPVPGFEYDAFTPETVAAVAEVQAIDRWTDPGRVCMRVSYQIEKVLRGQAPGSLVITQCSPAAPGVIEDFLQSGEEGRSPGEDAMGFFVGANVVVAVTSLPPTESMRDLIYVEGRYRYLAPSCWGPLHLSLSLLSEREREGILESIASAPTRP